MIEQQTSASTATEMPRDVQSAMLRGAAQRCPACGKGELYRAFLKVRDTCPSCGEALHHHRADDAPPYFTMLVTGHVVVGALMTVESTYAPPIWVHAVLWGPAVVILSLLLLPRIKGALIGMQWALRMHGFGGKADEIDVAPEARAGRA
ncbi:MAG: DUF983 domain-containing protein [Hyphomicrobiaceae bacterium]|nr:DUF983 domain-containing protein [Hyphomicrobiaceae bacterium]